VPLRLEALHIEGFADADCRQIGRLSALQSLSLARGALETLTGLRDCASLRAVQLAHLTSETGRFDDLQGMEALLPRFAESIQTTVLPELERYRTEGNLLDALLADDWLTSVKLSATPDRRGALVTLMLWRREGAEFATAWGMRELERIRAEKPFVTSTARYQELDRCIEYISALR